MIDKSIYDKYLDYIRNTGGNPTVEWFDEDWEPIGKDVRDRMYEEGLIEYVKGKIKIVGE